MLKTSLSVFRTMRVNRTPFGLRRLLIGGLLAAGTLLPAMDWPTCLASASASLSGWPVSNLIDGNVGTCWSSPKSAASGNHWIELIINTVPRDVDYIKLTPRTSGSSVYCFPRTFTVYYVSGNSWIAAQTYTDYPAPTSGAPVYLSLPTKVSTSGIRITVTKFGQDNYGKYYFQLAEAAAGLYAPQINSFSATPTSINRGQEVTLAWTTTGSGVTLNLDNSIGAVTGTSRTVAPTATTSYTLTAVNSGGTTTSSCTVTVNQPPVFGTVAVPAFEAGRATCQVLPEAATDPENDALAYTASGLPQGLAYYPSTRTLSGTVVNAGTYPFTYTATDAKGASVSTMATLTVSPQGPAQGTATGTIAYTYDDQGRLSTLTYPSGRVVTYAYDDLDRVVSVQQNGAAVMPQITYDDWGNPSRRQYGSGAMDEWAYDPTGSRVTQWTIGTVGGTPEARTYSYDTADRLIKAGEWDTLAYDANSRLTQAIGFGLTDTLAHDAYNNNISSVTTSAGIVPPTMNNYTFDPMVDNHLPGLAKNGGLTGVTETNFGEITAVAAGISAPMGLAMTWDALGRMTSTANGATGTIASYQYTASGLRVTRIDSLNPALNRVYAYTGTGQLLSEYTANPTPTWTRDVIYLGAQAIAEVNATGTHSLHSDHQGTPRVITSAAGSVEGTQAFGPYGELLQQTGYLPLTGYTGHLQTEPTGLIYMRGRFYSPAWHRFMNSDQGVDPNSINQFAYVIGNPFMLTDESGYDAGGKRGDPHAGNASAGYSHETNGCGGNGSSAVQGVGDFVAGLTSRAVNNLTLNAPDGLARFFGLDTNLSNSLATNLGMLTADGLGFISGGFLASGSVMGGILGTPESGGLSLAPATAGAAYGVSVSGTSAVNTVRDVQAVNAILQSSTNQLQTQAIRGQAPKGVVRVDKAHEPVTGQDHIHFEDGALNQDGTPHDVGKGVPDVSKDAWGWAKGWFKF